MEECLDLHYRLDQADADCRRDHNARSRVPMMRAPGLIARREADRTARRHAAAGASIYTRRRLLKGCDGLDRRAVQRVLSAVAPIGALNRLDYRHRRLL